MGDEFSSRPLVTKSFLVLILYIYYSIQHYLVGFNPRLYLYVTKVFPPIPRSTCCLLCNFIARTPADDIRHDILVTRV